MAVQNNKFINNYVKQTIISSLIAAIIFYQILPIKSSENSTSICSPAQMGIKTNSENGWNFDNVDNASAVLKFLENLIFFIEKESNETKVEDQAQANVILLALIEKHDDQSEFIEIINGLWDLIHHTEHDKGTLKKLGDIKRKIVKYFPIYGFWKDKVLYNKDSAVLCRFARKYAVYFDQIFIPEIIRHVVNNDKQIFIDNFMNIEKFVFNQWELHQRAIGSKTILEELERFNLSTYSNGQLIKFAYHTKANIQDPDYVRLDESYKKMFTDVTSRLSFWTKEFLWNGAIMCRIKNRKYVEEYLGVDYDYTLEVENQIYHKVFATRTANKLTEVVFDWKFEPIDQSDTFKIKIPELNEYMVTNKYGLSKPFRKWHVYSYPEIPEQEITKDEENEEDAFWEVIPLDEQSVLIKNKGKSMYLMADEEVNGKRRLVYVGNTTGIEAQWEWICGK